MLDFNDFTCFTLLSQELQDMIWSHSFNPQLISLHYANCPSTQPASPSIGSDDSYLRTEFAPNSNSLPSPRQLEPIGVPAPAIFSVCRASRTIAQSKGYKTWRLLRSDGKVRHLLWDPLIDTILFAGPCESHFNLFVQQFSAQASEIRSLALPHRFWDAYFTTKTRGVGRIRTRRGSRELLQLLKSPSSLQEMFVMVDKEFFESEVKGKAEDQLDFWYAPGCFGRGFYSALSGYRKAYGVNSLVSPIISVAWNFDMILRGEDVELPECLILDSFHARLEEWRLRRFQ